ncbi:hypothetical protein AHF37_04230, partial [Paragonimus kellicotti]
QLGEWKLQGLPTDELSIQNGIIVDKASRYPLLIDPQGQGKTWIKNREKSNDMLVTTLLNKYFRQHLEDALSQGRALMIEDVGEQLDPALDNVLERNFIKQGSMFKVKVGDKEVDVMKGFKLYITTKLANPLYTPEVSARTSIIDFTVTMKGLEDQLLGRVILSERQELESQRLLLMEDVQANKTKIKQLEDSLLLRLASVEGSLVDDVDLIVVLNSTKSTAAEVSRKLEIASETEMQINAAREEYRPIATRGSVLYFLIVEMSLVNCMYQTSLRQFLNLFDIALAKHEEFQCFIKGGASLDLNTVRPKPHKWITDMTWLNLVALSNLNQFAIILDQVQQNERTWRSWFDKATPESELVPDGYQQSLDPFRRLLLIRAWCPDRVMNQAAIFVTASLGQKFSETFVLDLDSVYAESTPRWPMVGLLSMGSDPTTQIELLAKKYRLECRTISMGQGQEVHAHRLLMHSINAGGWVLLQNCHLSLAYMTEVLNLLMDTEQLHEEFRLWVTTAVNTQFPISFLQTAIKFTTEPPQGIKASLKRTYASFTQLEKWAPFTAEPEKFLKIVHNTKHFSVINLSSSYLQTPPVLKPMPQLPTNTAYQSKKAKTILDCILDIQPKDASAGSGETREDVVYRMADDMLNKMPANYVAFEVSEKLNQMGMLQPMNIFLRQELDRMQRLIGMVRICLTDLKLAIEGAVVMSESLREALDCMYDARIPASWTKLSWDSSTLGFWFTELVERNHQFSDWLFNGRPSCFWMTGFFNPQGFLTAIRQEVTRSHKGWALDTVALWNDVTKHMRDEVLRAPQEGAYVYGLFLEGADFDRRNLRLCEAKSKVLYEPMPVIHVQALDISKDKEIPSNLLINTYICPVYRKPRRTDQTYVTSLYLRCPVSKPHEHWVLRGTALLCDIR